MSASAGLSSKMSTQQIQFLNEFFWGWYNLHHEDEIIKINVFIFSKTIRVKHLTPLFSLLFGPRTGSPNA